MTESEIFPISEDPIPIEEIPEPQVQSTTSLSLFSSRPESIISKEDVNFSDPLFPYSPEFD